MKSLLMGVAALLVFTTSAWAGCVKGTVKDVKDPMTVRVVCEKTGEVLDIPMYGLTCSADTQEAREFLERELVGKEVACFEHKDRPGQDPAGYYITYAEGGSFQNRYLLSGKVEIDPATCKDFICTDMLKYQEFSQIAQQ